MIHVGLKNEHNKVWPHLYHCILIIWSRPELELRSTIGMNGGHRKRGIERDWTSGWPDWAIFWPIWQLLKAHDDFFQSLNQPKIMVIIWATFCSCWVKFHMKHLVTLPGMHFKSCPLGMFSMSWKFKKERVRERKS
jgi:hypothetical protein